MINISVTGNTIQIDTGDKVFAFPKNSIWLHTTPDDEASIDVKLAATRAKLITFNYKDCNLAGASAYATLQNIMNIL